MNRLVAVVFLSIVTLPAVADAGSNRIAGFSFQGHGRIEVRFKAGKVVSNDVWVPAAAVNLHCTRSGYRPDRVIYGVAPLSYGAKRGHAMAATYNAKAQKYATKNQKFPSKRFWVKAAKHQNPLRKYQQQAMTMCTKGNGGNLKVPLRATGRCRKVKWGGGPDTQDIDMGKTVSFKVQCIGKPSAKKAPPKKPARLRHGRPRSVAPGRPGRRR